MILKWNDRHKIRLVDCAEKSMWSETQVLDLISHLDPFLERWTDDAKDALKHLGTIAATPGFINTAATMSSCSEEQREILSEKATSLALQWQHGIRALSFLHSEARCLNPAYQA